MFPVSLSPEECWAVTGSSHQVAAHHHSSTSREASATSVQNTAGDIWWQQSFKNCFTQTLTTKHRNNKNSEVKTDKLQVCLKKKADLLFRSYPIGNSNAPLTWFAIHQSNLEERQTSKKLYIWILFFFSMYILHASAEIQQFHIETVFLLLLVYWQLANSLWSVFFAFAGLIQAHSWCQRPPHWNSRLRTKLFLVDMLRTWFSVSQKDLSENHYHQIRNTLHSGGPLQDWPTF